MISNPQQHHYVVSVLDDAVSIMGPFHDGEAAGQFGDQLLQDLRWNVVQLDAAIEANPLFCGVNVPDGA